MLNEPQRMAHDLARRERRAWLYVSSIAVLISVCAFGFLWFTW
jgi:hypothetical protein